MALDPTAPGHTIFTFAEPLPFVSLKLATVDVLFRRIRHDPLLALFDFTEILKDCPQRTVEGADTEIPVGGGPHSSSSVLSREYSLVYWS